MDLDALDRGILDLLRKDARHSMRNLARQLHTTTPTVSARVRNLEGAGFLLGYHADVAEEALGGRVIWTVVQASPHATPQLAEAFGERPWVEEIHQLAAGRMLVRARLHDDGPTMQDLDAMLASLPAIASYEVHEAISGRRGPVQTITGKAIRTRCHQCGRSISGEGLTATLGGRRHAFCCVVCRDTFKQRFKKLVGA
ncbi:MAG TPA: AsnC family transcriptional regulator [Candidatus Thermoplasmatota archaeon]|nr:AsnC family transcriptional regulator [Candidatus Thermoplasmatota archaeon]